MKEFSFDVYQFPFNQIKVCVCVCFLFFLLADFFQTVPMHPLQPSAFVAGQLEFLPRTVFGCLAKVCQVQMWATEK